MFIPDGYKPEVISFLESPAGKAVVIALRLRCPPNPSAGESAHGMIQRYSQAEGFNKCIDDLLKIPHESQNPGEAVDSDPFKTQRD